MDSLELKQPNTWLLEDGFTVPLESPELAMLNSHLRSGEPLELIRVTPDGDMWRSVVVLTNAAPSQHFLPDRSVVNGRAFWYRSADDITDEAFADELVKRNRKALRGLAKL